MNYSPLHIARTALAGTIFVSCLMAGCGTKSNQPIELSPEQLRLEAINHLDSTSLPAVLSPDSIEGFEQLSDLSAQAWMLVDDSTGIIISQKNAYQHRTIASLTKMMTCLLSLEKGNPTDTVQITEEVFIAKDSRVRLGEAYELRHLIYEMMLISDNDAAYALAAHIGGDTLLILMVFPISIITVRQTTLFVWLAMPCAIVPLPPLWVLPNTKCLSSTGAI